MQWRAGLGDTTDSWPLGLNVGQRGKDKNTAEHRHARACRCRVQLDQVCGRCNSPYSLVDHLVWPAIDRLQKSHSVTTGKGEEKGRYGEAETGGKQAVVSEDDL